MAVDWVLSHAWGLAAALANLQFRSEKSIPILWELCDSFRGRTNSICAGLGWKKVKRLKRTNRQWARSRAGLALLAASLAGGCGLPSLGSGFGGMFGGGSPETTEAGSGVSAEQLLAEAKNSAPGTQLDTGSITPGCPKFVVWPQENNLTIYEPGRDGDGLAIMHRGEITKTKRECRIENGRVSVRYGFSGRVLLGPRGQSGPVTFPLHVIVSDDGRTQVAQDALSVSTTVALENPIGYFSAVREISFDVPEGTRPGDFEVRVGFDRASKKPADKKSNRRTS